MGKSISISIPRPSIGKPIAVRAMVVIYIPDMGILETASVVIKVVAMATIEKNSNYLVE